MFLERWLWQIFGENIGGLLSSLDIRHGDDTFAVLFTHIMLTQLDMLVSAADYWIVHHIAMTRRMVLANATGAKVSV